MTYQIQCKCTPYQPWQNLSSGNFLGTVIQMADQYKAQGLYTNVRVVNDKGGLEYQA